MKRFSTLVDKVIEESDVLLLVLDARKVYDSINKTLEKKIIDKGKKFIYVINKCDIISAQEQKKIKLDNSVQVSAKEHWSTLRLLRKIKQISTKKQTIVGVIGFPNTGKSTLINAMKGRHSAPTSSRSGFTKSLQKIRITQDITLIDTPGVFENKGLDKSLDKKDTDLKKLIIGSVDPEKLKDPEDSALKLIQELKGKIEKHYGLKRSDDPYDTLESIALKLNFLKKKGFADIPKASKFIIREWQKGNIK